MIVRFVPAVIGFWLAFDGGTYGLESRNSLAIVVWWVLIVGIGLGFLPRVRPTIEWLIAGGLLAALAALTLASSAWASSAENAFTEFNRVALYLGVFVLVGVAVRRSEIPAILDGIAVAVAATGAIALASRFFPALFPEGNLPDFLPAAQTRLSYPLNYWNGLAIFAAIGGPLLLRVAVGAERTLARAASVVPLPAFVAVMYLASSRGGFAIAAVGSAVFLALTPRRWAAAGAVAVGLLGSAVTIAVLVARPELVNGPLESSAARTQGWQAALLITLISVAGGLTYALGVRYAPRLIRPGPIAGRLAAASVIVLALAGIAATDPVDRFETFKQPPEELTESETDFVKAHLLSGNGSGRWQFWNAAVDEFEENPVVGEGAGAYAAWWLEHRPISLFAKDAHSLYLETLGELGAVGLALLGGVVITALFAAGRHLRRFADPERITMSALVAALVAYAVAVGIDWMWELTVVSVVGIALLSLAAGPATAPRQRQAEPTLWIRTNPRVRVAGGIGILLAAWLVICAQAIPLLTEFKLSDSEAAVRRGDAEEALLAADAARALQPWAASPYLQLALVHEHAGELERARAAIRDAIRRHPRDWRLWLVAARVETKLGSIPEARRSLDQAATLNPKSPLFGGIGADG